MSDHSRHPGAQTGACQAGSGLAIQHSDLGPLHLAPRKRSTNRGVVDAARQSGGGLVTVSIELAHDAREIRVIVHQTIRMAEEPISRDDARREFNTQGSRCTRGDTFVTR